jgi:hypothetical protein
MRVMRLPHGEKLQPVSASLREASCEGPEKGLRPHTNPIIRSEVRSLALGRSGRSATS